MGIHDERLDRGLATLALRVQIGRVERRAQGFRTEAGEERMSGRVLGQQHRAEAARVAQAQDRSVVEAPVDVVVARSGLRGLGEAQAPRHAEMDELGDSAEVEQQVFAAPGEAVEREAPQLRVEVGRDRPAQTRLANDDAGQHATLQTGRQAGAGGLDFG